MTRYIKKYGVYVEEDGYFDYSGNYRKLYNLYTADGCSWDRGLTWKGVQKECKEYGDTFKATLKMFGTRAHKKFMAN